MAKELKNVQDNIATIQTLQRASNINARESRDQVNIENLAEILSSFEKRVLDINSELTKLTQRVDLMDKDLLSMERETKLILDLYNIVRDMDLKLSTSVDCIIFVLYDA